MADKDKDTAEVKDHRQVARDAELLRQYRVVKAVERAHRDDLPKLGGKA